MNLHTEGAQSSAHGVYVKHPADKHVLKSGTKEIYGLGKEGYV